MTKEEQVYSEAKKFSACSLLKGTECTDELIELFFTPQGVEFCTTRNAPSLAAFRRFMGLQAVRGGFYIDTPIRAKNIAKLALIGHETVAELEYDETKGHKVVLMHGARAKITASGYAVVFVSCAAGTEVEVVENNDAKIFVSHA